MNIHEHETENWLSRVPHVPYMERIPHYYGDIVRILFIIAAVVVVGGAPLYSDALTQQMPFIIFAAIALVGLAALTSPKSVWSIRLDAVLAGVIAVVYETWALWGYQTGTAPQFVVRQVPALIGMFAFYFALKTLRAMLTGVLGEFAGQDDFPAKPRHATRGQAPAADGAYEDGLGHPAALEDDVGGMD